MQKPSSFSLLIGLLLLPCYGFSSTILNVPNEFRILSRSSSSASIFSATSDTSIEEVIPQKTLTESQLRALRHIQNHCSELGLKLNVLMRALGAKSTLDEESALIPARPYEANEATLRKLEDQFTENLHVFLINPLLNHELFDLAWDFNVSSDTALTIAWKQAVDQDPNLLQELKILHNQTWNIAQDTYDLTGYVYSTCKNRKTQKFFRDQHDKKSQISKNKLHGITKTPIDPYTMQQPRSPLLKIGKTYHNHNILSASHDQNPKISPQRTLWQLANDIRDCSRTFKSEDKSIEPKKENLSQYTEISSIL